MAYTMCVHLITQVALCDIGCVCDWLHGQQEQTAHKVALLITALHTNTW